MAVPPLMHAMGTHSGRIDPVNYDPPGGTYAWVFGSDIEDVLVDLSVGDFVTLTQSIDVTAVTVLSFACKFRQSPSTTAQFKLEVYAGTALKYTLQPSSGIARDYSARTINVSTLTGSQNIIFRFEAVSP